MALTRVSVKKLFGELDHDIPIHWEEGLTLLHGPNGSGKTSVLRTLNYLFNKQFARLRKMPISELALSFSDRSFLSISWMAKQRSKNVGGKISYLSFILRDPTGKVEKWNYDPESEHTFPLGVIEELIPHLTRVGVHSWRDMRTEHILDLEEVLDTYDDHFPGGFGRHPKRGSKTPQWLLRILNDNPVYLIEAQRLVSPLSSKRRPRRPSDEASHSSAVLLYGEELANKIKNTLADYAEHSQALDSTFPNRLLKAQREGKEPPSDEEIRRRYTAQADRRKRYVEIGLIDAGDELILPENLDSEARRVLDTYLDDIDDKLGKLNDVAQRLELFLDIVNGKLRRVYLEAARERGLISRTRRDQQLIDLESLSSGEQHEVVMAYGLLFREIAGTLVLIDEPELSLHVSWQLDFIPDLLRIAKVANLKFVAATHSPQIIDDRWDLTVALSDGV